MLRLTVIGLAAVALSACAQSRMDISRFDGKPVDPAQVEQSHAVCDGESKVARAQTPMRYGSNDFGLAAISSLAEGEAVKHHTFTSCMADRGLRVQWLEDTK